MSRWTQWLMWLLLVFSTVACRVEAGDALPPKRRLYLNHLVPIPSPRPLLADWPEFVQPIRERQHFEAPPLIDEPNGTLRLRVWRYSYHCRGIVEMPMRLEGRSTAVIVVHPWGIDDGQGWQSPKPAGTAFYCTPFKNRLYRKHVKLVLNPFLKRIRPHVRLVLYSLPGNADPIRTKLYRTVSYRPTGAERAEARRALSEKLRSFRYRGGAIPERFEVSEQHPAADYFRQFPGLNAGDYYNNKGFWQLPIPVVKFIDVDPDDVVLFDQQGYGVLRDYLKGLGVRHVLLCGYATDMCVCSTTAGYENLTKDFNVILVGDATLATFPASRTPAYATNAAIARASLRLFISQVSAIRVTDRVAAAGEVGRDVGSDKDDGQ